jgi:hypothetical protein
VEILNGIDAQDQIVLYARGELVEGSPVIIAKSAKAS